MFEVVAADDSSAWDSVLDEVGRYDVYHTSAYHRLETSQSDDSAELFVFRDEDRTIIFPYILRRIPVAGKGSFLVDATSVYGYPGPIANAEAELPGDLAARFRNSLYSYLQSINCVSLFARLHPILSPTSLLGGEEASGTTVYIDLTNSLDEQLAQCRKTHRYEMRKARKAGVTTSLDKDLEQLDEFISIYEHRMKALGASQRYFFSRTYFDLLRSELGKHCIIVHAHYEGEIVASSMFFLCRGGVQYHLSGTRDGFEKLSPSRLILEDLRVWAKENSFRWLHLGGGVGGSDDALLRFKSGFSPDRATFHTSRLVLDEENYRILTERQSAAIGGKPDSGFFPLYRAPGSS